MNQTDLLELREIFRTRMQEEDFCIGEGQVEKLFRELLGEPEPVREVRPPGKGITSEMVSRAYVEAFKRWPKENWAGDAFFVELSRQR